MQYKNTKHKNNFALIKKKYYIDFRCFIWLMQIKYKERQMIGEIEVWMEEQLILGGGNLNEE